MRPWKIIPRSRLGSGPAQGELHLYAPHKLHEKKLHLDGYVPDQIQSGKNIGKFRDKYVSFELDAEDMVTLRNFINWILEREE
jgi:hypothetical protein|tara:strand:- start:55 stop:303 length:249 start_codon:yes stop_codon:yes gene_type:complete